MISKLSFELLCLDVILTNIGVLFLALAVRRLIGIFKQLVAELEKRVQMIDEDGIIIDKDIREQEENGAL